MSFYNEQAPGRVKAIIFLAIAFFLIFSPLQLGDRELYWSEGDYSAMTMEMDFSLPLTIAHGELIPATFPLFPWISALLFRYLGVPMEFALRFISVFALAALAALAWDAGRRALNIQAGAVAAAVMLSSVIIIEKSLDGYPNMLALLFIFMGWLVWFTFGVAKGSWNRAWIYSMLCCGLAFYTLGWASLIYFAFPLIFMRRPLTVWTKLQRPGFFAGLALLSVFIFLWGFSRWSAGTDIPFSSLPINKSVFEDYIQHIITFPFEIILRFLPWSIIAWTPFCVAYHPLDKNPIFSRFLRTIFISLFFLLWLSPFTRSRDLIILAPPLAVMTGINYWLLVRRHGHQIHKLLKIFSYIALLGGAFIIAFYLLPVEWWQDLYPSSIDTAFRYNSKNIVFGIIQGALCIICGILMFMYTRRNGAVWEHILLLTTAAALFQWALLNPYKAQDNSKREMGKAFRIAMGNAFKPSLTIFKDKNISGLYAECYYLGCNVRKIHSFDELPVREKEVYLISTEAPVFPGRLWENLLPESKKYKDQRICLWKGVRVEVPKKK